MSARLRALSGRVPGGAVGNDVLAARFGVSDEWITSRSGIAARRRVSWGVSTADLAAAAGADALALCGDDPVDALILATTTPDRPVPATAPEVATRLGLRGAAALDVNAACSGFPYGLATAAGMLATGAARRVLLVCADVLSRLLDEDDRDTAILMADGAAALVLEPASADAPGSFSGWDLGSDGSGAELLWVPAGGIRRRIDAAALLERADRLRMDGRAVYRNAVEAMSASARRCLDREGLEPGEVDVLIGHQANLRILAAVAERLGIAEDRHFANITRLGNTSAASIPLALAELAAGTPPRPGARVLLTAFGAGFTWGSVLLRWPEDLQTSGIRNYEEEPPWTTCSSA